MFGQRTEDRGPIRRYRKGRGARTKPTNAPQPPASDADAGMGSATTSTPSGVPVTGTPILPPSASLEAELVSGVSRNRLGIVLTVGLFLVVIAAVAIPLLSLGNTIHSFSQAVFSKAAPSPSQAPTTPSPRSGPHVSYLSASGARAGLAQIARAAPGARVALVRIDANSISAMARLPGGAIKEIVIRPDTGSFVIGVPAIGERPIPISQVSPAGVAKIVAEMKARFHVPPARIDYMVLSTTPGRPAGWLVYANTPGHPGYTATLSGGHLARLP